MSGDTIHATIHTILNSDPVPTTLLRPNTKFSRCHFELKIYGARPIWKPYKFFQKMHIIFCIKKNLKIQNCVVAPEMCRSISDDFSMHKFL